MFEFLKLINIYCVKNYFLIDPVVLLYAKI